MTHKCILYLFAILVVVVAAPLLLLYCYRKIHYLPSDNKHYPELSARATEALKIAEKQ